MANNTILGNRKFYKIRSLVSCFQSSSVVINNSSNICYNGKLKTNKDELILNGIENIDNNTIIFITASSQDSGRYVCVKSYNSQNEPINQYLLLNEGDTLIWVKGDFYSISSKSVKNVETEDRTENGINEKNLIFTFSDGNIKKVNLNELLNKYTGLYPISIENNTISLQGITIDGINKNIYEFENSVYSTDIENPVMHSHVEGVGNTSTTSYQHIQGKYSEPDNSSIFIIGGGDNTNNRKNLLTVGFDGIIRVENDVIVNDNKLSDIHNVLNSDWVVIGETEKKLSFSKAFDKSFK